MRLTDIQELLAGGQGSGCNPLVGRCGRLSKGHKKVLEQKGHLISLKKSGTNFPGTPETSKNILKKYQITQSVYPYPMLKPHKNAFVTYTYTHLKSHDAGGIPRDKTSTPFKYEPPHQPHSMKGKFLEVARVPVKEENRNSIIYDAGFDDEGKGSTVFVHHYRTSPTSSRTVLEEFEREGKEIVGKHEMGFAKSKYAKEFLKHRYGIDVSWSKK